MSPKRRARKKQDDEHKLKLKTKQEFLKEYEKYDESNARKFYLDVLSKLEKSIAGGSINNLKCLCNTIDNISSAENEDTVRKFYNDSSNPLKNTNLIILACKHNQPEVLKHLLSHKTTLENLSIHKGDSILPNDEDETCHNAFYYAVRSGNVDLLEPLIAWTENIFDTHFDELDAIISTAYEELQLKNVPLTDEMEISVENKLVNGRFFSDNYRQIQTTANGFDNIEKRIELVLENIDLLTTEFSVKEVDELFLYILTFIAQNVHILKCQLKSTYDQLPWEEIEFCLICFVSLHRKEQEINLFYHATLDKRKILHHLENFARKLGDVKESVKGVSIDKLTKIPNLNRETIVEKIMRNNPEFEELYKNYHLMRDAYSLEKIGNYISLASSVDPDDREGQLTIMRVLQLIGEYLKNTLESPKLSNLTSDLLLLTLAKNTRKVVTDLRNSLSHAFSLFKRTEIRENSDGKFFTGVQSDLRKVGEKIIDILYKNKIKIIKIILERIIGVENLDEIIEVLKTLKNVDILKPDFRMLLENKKPEEVIKSLKNIKSEEMTSNFRTLEHEKLEKLIKELKSIITDKTCLEEQLFSKIVHEIDYANSKFKNTRNDYLMAFMSLKSLQSIDNYYKIDYNIVRGLKFRAKKALTTYFSPITSYDFKKIAKLSMKVFDCVKSRKHKNLDDISRLFYEIFFIADFQTGDIKWIEEFRGKLKEEESSKKKKRKSYDIKMIDNHLELKLSELKSVFRNNLSKSETTEKVSSYRNDKKMQAVVEMLLLDIMSILDESTSNDYLVRNQFFLDDNYPLLTGRCLRNHLAHDNILFDILTSNPSTAIILNAEIFAKEDIITSKRKLGKMTTSDPLKLREMHNRQLKIITYQRKMFDALEEGNLDILKDCLKNGADINGRSIKSWTALHYAAKGPSLEVIKFILDQNVQVNVEDQDGQIPLHIAAAYGNASIVEYFVNDMCLSVDAQDKYLRTPLHIAARNGHEDIVKVLLKYNANSSAEDAARILPLHYAIRNNHYQIAKIFLEKNINVDINESMGGFTPLHEAAELGHLEIVTFLLQNQADVNSKNDRNRSPLHAAAFNGHVDIVNALISKGADVNAKVIDGCTALHYALENGHEEIASILLSYGAKPNVTDKTYNFTPLHYAAKDGHKNSVRTLLKYGADATIATVAGITPLHFAAQNGYLEIITILLKQGADIHARDINNATPIHFAAESGQEEAVVLLIKNGTIIDVGTYCYFTPLYVAVQKGHKNIIDFLIKNKANVNVKDILGNTILHAAVMNGFKYVTEVLIKHNAEVNARNNFGFTPLHVASLEGYADVVVFLVENKAEVNTADFNGFTPLHHATVGGHKHIVEFLIKNKSNINARIIRGATTLHLAVEAGDREIIKILIENGANVNADSEDNYTTPLFTAVKRNYKDIVEVLLENGATVDDNDTSPLSLAVLAGYKDIVEILIKNRDKVDTVPVDNVTLLHFAATRGHKDIVKTLLKRGVDVNAKIINNITPLYAAAEGGHEEVVEFLIANGAYLHFTSNEGSTPLHVAAAYGHSNVTKVLLGYKVNADVKDNKNRTPLELAVAKGHLDIVKMLLQYKKTDVNAKGNDDWTLLHIATQGKNLEIVKYLINEGADINSKNASGSKPMHIAAREGFKDAVNYFLTKGCNINDVGAFNQTLLHYAVMKNSLEMVKYLIDKGAGVNAKDRKGVSPLHLAAHYNYLDVIKILLKSGAAYNIADYFGRKALDMVTKGDASDYLMSTKQFFEAVKTNNLSEVGKYIKAGVIVDVKNADGATPLHFAAWKGHEEVLDILLKNNSNPNITGNKGITPLHYAAKFSHLKVVKTLLSYGAVFNAVTDSGKTSLDFSTDKSIIDLLILVSDSFENITNGNSKVMYDLNKIKDVNTIKAIMNACNKEKDTLIVVAIRCNFPKVEQLKDILQDGTSDTVNMSLAFAAHGDFQNALLILNKVYEKRKHILGSNNPGTLEIERHIASILYKQGNYKEALEKLERIYHNQKEMLGLNNKETLKTRSIIALVLHRQGKDEEAFEIFQKVYQIQKEVIGPNHQDSLDTQFHMALVLNALGKYEEALNINRRLYEERKRKLGAKDHLTIITQNNVAMTLANQGDYEQALKIYREVLEKKKVLLGPHHADTLRTRQSIATIFTNQKKHQEALEVYQEVLSVQKNILGPSNPETLKTQHDLGNLLFEQGKFANAFKMYTECFEKINTIFGPTSAIASDISRKLEVIKFRFKLEDSTLSEIILHMQDDMKTAVINGDILNILRFIKEGINVNEKDSNEITLLHYAASYEQLETVIILLKNGADVFHATNKGNTPLHIAALKNNTEIVEVLLQHVPHDKLRDFINSKTISGDTTALHVAAKNGSLNIVKILLKYGAIFDIKNKEGKKPQELSKYQSVANFLKSLEELFNDAKNGNEEIVEKLKSMKQDEFKAVTNARNNEGNTLLQVAITKKNAKIAQMLSDILKNRINN